MPSEKRQVTMLHIGMKDIWNNAGLTWKGSRWVLIHKWILIEKRSEKQEGKGAKFIEYNWNTLLTSFFFNVWMLSFTNPSLDKAEVPFLMRTIFSPSFNRLLQLMSKMLKRSSKRFSFSCSMWFFFVAPRMYKFQVMLFSYQFSRHSHRLMNYTMFLERFSGIVFGSSSLLSLWFAQETSSRCRKLKNRRNEREFNSDCNLTTLKLYLIPNIKQG